MDHIGRRGRRVVAGDADDRPIGRQPCERTVDRLDHLLLLARILRMSGGVRALHVTQHERITGVEPFPREADTAAQVRRGVVRLALVACL
jgi:hypothetical protein